MGNYSGYGFYMMAGFSQFSANNTGLGLQQPVQQPVNLLGANVIGSASPLTAQSDVMPAPDATGETSLQCACVQCDTPPTTANQSATEPERPGTNGPTGPGAGDQTQESQGTEGGCPPGCQCTPCQQGTQAPQPDMNMGPQSPTVQPPGSGLLGTGGDPITTMLASLNQALGALSQMVNALLAEIQTLTASGSTGTMPPGTTAGLGSAPSPGGGGGGGDTTANTSEAPAGPSAPASGQTPGESGFILPLDARFIDKPGDGGDFGPRNINVPGASTNHRGNDFGTGAEEPPIYAVKSGTIRIRPNNGGAGNTVEIDHGDGTVTKYFHLSRFGEFEDGQQIEQGQVLGYVGTTGTSSGNHLHFEVHQNGQAVDPWPFLAGLV